MLSPKLNNAPLNPCGAILVPQERLNWPCGEIVLSATQCTVRVPINLRFLLSILLFSPFLIRTGDLYLLDRDQHAFGRRLTPGSFSPLPWGKMCHHHGHCSEMIITRYLVFNLCLFTGGFTESDVGVVRVGLLWLVLSLSVRVVGFSIICPSFSNLQHTNMGIIIVQTIIWPTQN